MIYFIQSGLSGPIKIGYTRYTEKAQSRLKQLQTGSWEKLHLVCIIRGAMSAEQGLHEEFQEYRLQGEWFQPVIKLLDMINQLMQRRQTIQVQTENNDLRFYRDRKQIAHQTKQALVRTRNNKQAAAKLLNISRSTLYARIEDFNIDCRVYQKRFSS